MRLVAVGLLAAGAVLVLMGPWVAARLFDGRAPARIVATFHVLALVGMLALPAVVLGCLAVVRPRDLAAFAGAGVVEVAQWFGRGLGVAYVGWVGWVALRIARTTSRHAAVAMLATEQLQSEVDDGVRLLPTAKPVAYAVGGAVVISRGLLDLLDAGERDAVLAHEFAHLRLRHHRLLLIARVATATLGQFVPAVRHAGASLARELEVIADQAAAGVRGRRTVARALAKAFLADDGSLLPSGAALVSGGERDLAYRLDQLDDDLPTQDRGTVARWAVTLLAVALLVILEVTVRPAGVVFGLALIGWLCCRAVRTPAQSLR